MNSDEKAIVNQLIRDINKAVDFQIEVSKEFNRFLRDPTKTPKDMDDITFKAVEANRARLDCSNALRSYLHKINRPEELTRLLNGG